MTKIINTQPHPFKGAFVRNTNGPIIVPDDLPFPTQQVYNPSPVMYDDKTVLLLSVVPYQNKYLGQTHVAFSDDGINFDINPKPFIDIVRDEYPWNKFWHVIDNRVTKIDDTYYILTPVCVHGFGAPCMVLGKTKDFTKYELMDVVTQPQNRGASLFPEKIDGKYFKLDRPGAENEGGDIWLSSSPDLLHWGGFRPVLADASVSWIFGKIGPTPPVKTDAGWLVIFHGTHKPAGGTVYRIGAFLLDLKEPWKVLGVTKWPLLEPIEEYERHGYCDNCVFPCGVIADHERDELRLYYGAADTYVGLATACLSDVIEACLM